MLRRLAGGADSDIIKAVALRATVKVNGNPTVTLTSPVGGSHFTAPASLVLSATAGDSDGTVAQVNFFGNGVLVGTVTQAPYTMTVPNVAAGTYNISAQAIDSFGGVTNSAAAVVNVVFAPNVTLAVNQTSAAAPATFILSAQAVHAESVLAQVQYFSGNRSLGTATVAPYAFNWANVAAGSYTLTAVARDQFGTTVSSAPVAVVVTGTSAAAATVYYVQTDQLNTPRVVSDESNSVMWRWDVAVCRI